MPCNASYARFIFGKFFTSTIILYVLLFAQFFYSCKTGCYSLAGSMRQEDLRGPLEGGLGEEILESTQNRSSHRSPAGDDFLSPPPTKIG
jgi:hypothetical protein